MEFDGKGRRWGMKSLTLKKIAEVCKGTLHCCGKGTDGEISGVVLDSRQIKKDNLDRKSVV